MKEEDARASPTSLSELAARLTEEAAKAKIVAQSIGKNEQRTADVARAVGAFVEHLLRELEHAREKPTTPGRIVRFATKKKRKPKPEPMH